MTNTKGTGAMGESKYANRPNILRVSRELAGYKAPDKILTVLRSVMKGSVDDSANSQNDIGLTVR